MVFPARDLPSSPSLPPDPPPRGPQRTTRDAISFPDRTVSLSELLAALSHALDLTEGQPDGHTLRSCFIGMRLGELLELDEATRSALYYALLLKDAGCSSNAARFASLFGSDDRAGKYRMKFPDWHRTLPLAVESFRTAGSGGLRSRVRHFVRVARAPGVTRELIGIRCDRGAEIADGLGFPESTAAAIRHLDEHWCGRGHPAGLAGEVIPLLSRIASLAQTVEIFYSARGKAAALRVLRERRGSWFDPRLVDLLLGTAHDEDWWARLASEQLEAEVVAAEPGELGRAVNEAGLDEVATAFADIIDAKSPYTFRHSSNVALYARAIARELGIDEPEQRRIYRAGLLHDIGKLGTSSRILDKPGRLDPAERAEIERHPLHTWEILSRVSAFRDFARLASLHHEKLDGSGYPWGVTGNELGTAERILCVADIFEALTADRPYRAGMPIERALEILHEDAGTRLCPDAIAGLRVYLDRRLQVRKIA